MKPYVWNPDQSLEDQKNGAYWERNMLALLLATILRNVQDSRLESEAAGWYQHQGGEVYEGWSRVISLYWGAVTFHVPDDFDLGTLPEIAPNWDEHTTEEKWNRVMAMCGIEVNHE